MQFKQKAVLAVLALLSVSALAQGGTHKTLTGVVSDTMCGATHMLKNKSAAECTRMCVKEGSSYALVVGEKVYALKGNPSDLNKYAGEKVKVVGAVNGDTVNAESIAPVK